MNERIRELADQAAEGMAGALNIPDEFCEKFAELLIRKCAIIADTAQAEDMGWDIGEIIKEHFGVEE
jgi:hypothetical protein